MERLISPCRGRSILNASKMSSNATLLRIYHPTFDDRGVFRDCFKFDKDIIVKAADIAVQPIRAPVVIILLNLKVGTLTKDLNAKK